MTTTPTGIASTIPAAEDSCAMCFRQGKACVYASEEDGRIIITEPPGGVGERLDTRSGQITGSGRTAARANGTGHQPPIPKLTMVIGGNGAGKTTWCKGHLHELPEAFYNPDAIAQDTRLLASSRIRGILEFRRPQDVVVLAASSDQQRVRVLTSVKARRSAPPPLSRGSRP